MTPVSYTHLDVYKRQAFDRAAAQKVLRQVLQKPDSTLCLATGDTTAGIFTRMVE